MSTAYKDDQGDWLTVCLKYLLFVFNFLFWSDYLSLLASSTFAVSAYILILAGSLVVVTGFLGCCAVIREQKSCLSTLVAGVLAYVYYQRFKCCGSNNSGDWLHSVYIESPRAEDRLVPDSCCKTITPHCGRRDHPSNIYKVEGGCITKLEQFLADHLL
ncbi:hypothetical protein CRUP_027726, partial [Coryphaenoides rupestris]